jgi:hypothetical protein
MRIAHSCHPERSRRIPLRKLKGNFVGIARLSLEITEFPPKELL